MTTYQLHGLNNSDIQGNVNKKMIRDLFEICNEICFGYARQSTINQKSISEQITEIKEKAYRDGYDYAVIFTYKGSGWNIHNINKMKQFNEMIKLIKYLNDFDIHIYIYDISRFMRNVLIATKFINDVFDPYNCTIHSIIDNKVWDKNNRNRIEFLQGLVEAEKFAVQLSDKIKKNIKYRKTQGHHIGKAKFGYERFKVNNIYKIRENNVEQNILGYIKKEIGCKRFKSYKHNRYHYNKICDKLNYNNLLKRGKEWNIKMLEYVVFNNMDRVVPSELNIKNETDYWIQCDECDKWRKLPYNSFFELKDKMIFNCNDTRLLNCNIPEESYTNSIENTIDIENGIDNLTL
jgi:DNA invertase Pin-like site-specific DNA recombinase